MHRRRFKEAGIRRGRPANRRVTLNHRCRGGLNEDKPSLTMRRLQPADADPISRCVSTDVAGVWRVRS